MHPTPFGTLPVSQARPTAAAVRARQRLAYRLLREASLELARLRRIRGAYRETARRIAGARRRLALAAALLAAPLAGPAVAGTPTFVSPFLIPNVGSDASPAFADIDGDGDLDAFVGNADGNTVFFRNTGTASAPAFAGRSTNPFGLANVGSRGPTFTDLDGDGDLDAFFGLGSGDTILFENTGTASTPAFAMPSTNPFGLADVGSDASPTFADIDGDGDLDAFVGGKIGCGYACYYSLAFFANTGTASAPAFAAPTNPYGLGPGEGRSPIFADIDGDGDLDAFVGSGGGNTIFFENTGTASVPAFAAASANPFGLANAGLDASPAFADLDGDGDLDAFVGERSGNTTLFENTGTANAPAFAASSGNPFGLADVGNDASPAFADVDGDGDLDAFVGGGGSNTIFFENTGTASVPAFAAASANPFGLASAGFDTSPAFADLDGDGDLDAFIGEFYGNTIFFANTGTASAPAFAPPSTNPFGLADMGFVVSPAFADLDGDGDLDAFVGEELGSTIFFANTGTASVPAFAAPSTNPFGLADVGYDASPAFVDVDGDGDLDAFIGEFNGNTIFFANTGTANAPAFAAPSTDPFGLRDVGRYVSPAFADLDGDGDLDALVGEEFGNTFFFENLELGPGTCMDGLDNDFDDDIDYPVDSGCQSPADLWEGSSVCDNGADDDGDGLADFPEDPGCQSPQDDSEWTTLGPSCARSQLHALADLCSAQLRCRAQDMKSPSASRLNRCLAESESKLSSALAKGAAASVKAGEVCLTGQASASAPDLEASAVGLAAEVLAGADLSNRSDAALRAAITHDAGVTCGSDLRTLAQEIRRPSADHGNGALLAARERFLGSAGKAIQKADKGGVSYDGAAPNAIADALRAVAEELADQLSP